MATALDNALGPVAAQMVNQFGATVIMRGGEVSSYNAETGVISKSQQTQTRKAIIGAATSIFGAGAKTTSTGVKPNATDSSYDKETFTLTMARVGEEFAPQTGYEVEFNSKKYKIQSVTPSYSGELVATYSVVVSL